MIELISTAEAVEIMREHGLKTDPQRLGLGLQQRAYPFGTAIKAGRWIYDIYKAPLMRWLKEMESGE